MPGDLPGRHPAAAPDPRTPPFRAQVAAQAGGGRALETAEAGRHPDADRRALQRTRAWGATPDGNVRDRMRDSTRFVLQLLESNHGLVEPGRMSLKIAYHDSCQSLRQLGLKSEPRRVLELAGYEVVDLPDIANCCGFGGSFSLEWPGVADRLAQWKLDAIAKTGCSVVASDNPGCLMHIAAAARKRGIELRVAHVLELVAEHLA